MGFLGIMAYYFGFSVLGDSVLGEHLMNAATDGDVQEAKAILEYNPRLAGYSTSGLDKSPLHCAAKRGHHQIVSLLLESGVKIDHVNSRGQTALMKACQYGRWEVVQSLMLLRADVHKADYRGGTALHYAAISDHTHCIRLLLAGYVPSIPDFWNFTSKRSLEQDSTTEFDEGAISSLLNKTENGGFTALHMAALYGHAETIHLLVSLGASVSEVTVEDGTILPFKKKDGTIPDPIGQGSTPFIMLPMVEMHDAVNI